MAIFIHYIKDSYSFPDENILIPFLEWLIDNEQATTGDINLVFTDNTEILRLNKKYLNHDYYTDVIAFSYGVTENIDGDIFISVDKVFENSKVYNTNFNHELLRVIFHGFLHLIGYGDKTEEEHEIMQEKEDYYLKSYYLKNK